MGMRAARLMVRASVIAVAAAAVLAPAGAASARPAGLGSFAGPAVAPQATDSAPASVPARLSVPASAPAPANRLPPGQELLSGVSCPTKSLCMVVGSSEASADSPVSQIWNGQAWRVLPVPQRQTDSALAAVSCPSATRCVAVGSNQGTGLPFGDAWNGKTWRTLPAVPVSGISTLTGVSCVSATDCIAVGSNRAGSSAAAALAEFWNGKTWRRLASAAPAGTAASELAAISCIPTATSCLAVGHFLASAGSSQADLAESWNGSTWTRLSAPAGSADLDGVSCPTVGTCVVVGRGPFAAVRTAGAWTTLATPSPGGTQAELTGVSCTSASNCVAVGEYPASVGGGDLPFAETWTGGPAWRLRTVPHPVSELPGLTAVSCPGPARCLAAGGFPQISEPGLVSVAASWNGRAWRVFRAQRMDTLPSVSCVRASRCLAVGSYLNGADRVQTLAQAWNGKTWRLASPAHLLGAFTSVSCAGPSFCMATGTTYLGSPLAQAWNGIRWRSLSSPGVTTQLSCVSSVFCLAVSFETTAQTWNGTRWRVVPPVLVPVGNTTRDITGVSCTRPSYCMAVGGYSLDPHGAIERTLADVWNGATWQQLRTPQPGNDRSFNGVSCVLRSGCMAVGNDAVTLKPFGHNLAARWNGRAWRVFELPGGFGSGTAPIDGLSGPVAVSCPGPSSCMAEGSYGDLVQPFIHDLTVAWNGRAWRLTKNAEPGGSLADVSCPRAGFCAAVGGVGAGTLAERWNGKNWQLQKSANP
jgi:hypothetical protein